MAFLFNNPSMARPGAAFQRWEVRSDPRPVTLPLYEEGVTVAEDSKSSLTIKITLLILFSIESNTY
jgi:hypothetical protein